MLSPTTKRNIDRIIPFGIIWLVFSVIYSLLERSLLGNLDHYPSTGNPYNFSRTLFTTAITATLLGLLVGAMEILYLNKLFHQKGFIKKVIYKTIIYIGIIILFLLITTIIYNSIELNAGLFNQHVWSNVLTFFFDYAFWSVEMYIASIIGVSLFYTEVSENLGKEVLANFFSGKYHTPTEEKRIFMFVDMKSSTTIAEKIGHVKYFEMLKEYFADLSEPIIQYSGEIYQYVGDEIVISWKVNNELQNNNCIQCFFAMKASLKNQTQKYQAIFGTMPEFKAGLHVGKVTTGEVGVVKKDIVFTGDVLNTTARIQGLCNAYHVDILLSGDLLKQLPAKSEFQFVTLGENELRGRGEKVKLFTIVNS